VESEEIVHNHDADMEFTVPSWWLWTAIGIPVGFTVGWLVWNSYCEWREFKVRMHVIESVLRSLKEGVAEFRTEVPTTLNGQVNSDESAVL
jgi:hypothetical protein